MATTIPNSSTVTAANKANGFTQAQSDAGTKLSADFNFFLKMLTTQLQHQDPTEPMDVSQMTNQIVQFSGVEQQVQTNTKLDALLKTNTQSQLATGVSYIGSEVETAGSTGGVLGGQGAFAYILPEAATTAKIVIKDASGTAVFSGDGTKLKGRNIVVWDGKNSFTGEQMPDGNYKLEVTAKNAKGEEIKVDSRAVGIVTSVETKNGEVMLTVGGVEVKLSDILTVRTPNRVDFGDGEEEGEDTTTGGTDTVTGGNDDESDDSAEAA
jgi:flagellar basal-body rod modification protein FlgD